MEIIIGLVLLGIVVFGGYAWYKQDKYKAEETARAAAQLAQQAQPKRKYVRKSPAKPRVKKNIDQGVGAVEGVDVAKLNGQAAPQTEAVREYSADSGERL